MSAGKLNIAERLARSLRALASAAVLLCLSSPPSLADDATRPTSLDPTPTAYRIALTIVPSKTRFTGHVEIDVNLATPRQVIRLDGRDLSMTRVEARVAGGTIPGSYRQIDEAGHARVEFKSALPAGHITLSFSYSGPILAGPGGLFRANVDGDWYVWCEAFPNARRVYPVFDQRLNTIAPFTMSITAPRGMTAVSSTPEVATISEGELIRHEFATTKAQEPWNIPMDVGAFASRGMVLPPNAVRHRPLPLRVLAPRSQGGKLSVALAESGAILEQLEDYLQVPFPYAKLDEVVSPLEKGGLSAAGAILYGSDFFLLGSHDPVRLKQRFAKIVSHETSHQWFGNMLMPASWGDMWLDETFANFVGPEVVSRWKPEWSQATFAAYGDMDTEMLAGEPALHQPRLSADNFILGYLFAYGKGSQVLAMLNTYLGDQGFRAGVRTYIERHRFQTVTTKDFIQDMAVGSGDPIVTKILNSYINQPGLPLLSLRRQGNTLRVTQKTAREATGDHRLWTIPFCYRQGNRTACTVLRKESTNISLSGSAPVVPNVSGSGYYRFDMPDKDWSAMIALSPSLPAGDALAINDSLWAAFRFGNLNPRRLIDAMQAMATSPEPSVELDGPNRWAALRSQGVVPDQADADYSAVLRQIFSPALQALGADLESARYAAEDPKRQLVRAGLIQILAVDGHDEQLDRRLSRAAAEFLTGNRRALDSAFLSTALTAYLRAGGPEAAETLLKAAVRDQGGLERPLIISALGSVDDAKIATRLISNLGHSGLQPTDEMDLVAAMLGQSHSSDIALPWVLQNYMRLAALGINRGWSPYIFTSLCSTEDANKVEALLTADGQKSDVLVTGTLEPIKACAALRTAKRSDMAQALHAAAALAERSRHRGGMQVSSPYARPPRSRAQTFGMT